MQCLSRFLSPLFFWFAIKMVKIASYILRRWITLSNRHIIMFAMILLNFYWWEYQYKLSLKPIIDGITIYKLIIMQKNRRNNFWSLRTVAKNYSGFSSSFGLGQLGVGNKCIIIKFVDAFRGRFSDAFAVWIFLQLLIWP